MIMNVLVKSAHVDIEMVKYYTLRPLDNLLRLQAHRMAKSVFGKRQEKYG